MRKPALLILLILLFGCNESDDLKYWPLTTQTESRETETAPQPDNESQDDTLPVTLSVDSLDLSQFPLVTIHLNISGPIGPAELDAQSFQIINAGKTMDITSLSEANGLVTLTFPDTTCGNRRLQVLFRQGNCHGKTEIITYGRNYAMLVGIDDYRSKENDSYDPGKIYSWDIWPIAPRSWSADLKSCVNDVKALEESLTQSQMWSSNSQISLLTDKQAQRAEIMTAMGKIISDMQPEDLFVFFFSGHGSKDGGEFLLAANAPYDLNDLISVDDLALALNRAPATALTNVFVILDSCFSGNFTALANTKSLNTPTRSLYTKSIPLAATGIAQHLKSFSKNLSSGIAPRIAVITASDGETTSEAGDYGELSVFTQFFTEGLRYAPSINEAPANSNADSWIDGFEAYRYVYNYCKSQVAQQRGTDNPIPPRLLSD